MQPIDVFVLARVLQALNLANVVGDMAGEHGWF